MAQPDYLEISNPFDQEFYTGTPTLIPQVDVPIVFPCSIAGVPFQLDLKKFRMTTMQVRRVALDDSVEPGEQSLNAAGVWPRAQDNWFLGAGQLFLDNRFAFETIYTHTGEAPSVRTRFWRSKGLYINSEGNLSLQPAQVLKYATTAFNCVTVACGSYLYVVGSDGLHWTDDPTPNSPVWHGPVGGGPNAPITSVTTDGTRVWAACGADGVYVTSQGSMQWSRAARPAALVNPTGVMASLQQGGPVSAWLTGGQTYIYAVTAVDAFGNETNRATVGGGIVIKESDPPVPIQVAWSGNPLATGFNVYRRESDGGTWVWLRDDYSIPYSVAAATPYWTDSGGSVPFLKNYPVTNQTGASDYAASFVSYCDGYLIGSTGSDLVNIQASGNPQFIYEASSPNFVFTFAFSTPTAIHVGGSANGQAFIGAIQPDSQTQGANLAPPYTATTLPAGEIPYTFAYNAGSIIMGTSAGIRTGTAPDSTGVFDINPVITDTFPVQCLAAWDNYCYYGWPNYQVAFDQPGIPDPDVFRIAPATSGLGKLDLSQYTASGVPAYATDAMVPDADTHGLNGGPAVGAVTSVTILPSPTVTFNGATGLPFFSVQGAGVYGPDVAHFVPDGWMEVGWTRFSTQEPKILCRADVLHDPLAQGCVVELDLYDQFGHKSVGGVSATRNTTGPLTYFQLNRDVGDKFMPLLRLHSNSGKNTPVLHEWVIWGMVVPVRQDEWMLPIQLFTRVNDLTAGGGQPHYQSTFDQYMFLKSLEANGVPVPVEVGGLTAQCYIDQIQVTGEETTKWNDARTFPECTVMVKVITLGPVGQGPNAGVQNF
jgi:hypothetical protein